MQDLELDEPNFKGGKWNIKYDLTKQNDNELYPLLFK